MAQAIDEAVLIAWVDGELDEATGAHVAAAVAADPDLAALADGHRRMKARFAAAFGPLAQEPVAMPAAAPVVSLAAARAERQARSPRPWYQLGGAIAASLLIGVLVGHQLGGAPGVQDRPGTLALAAPLAKALDGQLSGEPGAVRVALSFRDHDNRLCRGFAAGALSGVACRQDGAWQLRYAAPNGATGQTDYRMAGGDIARAQVIDAMIAGEPLDRGAEEKARAAGWSE